MAYNEPGQPPQVEIREADVHDLKDRLIVSPCSVTVVAVKLR